MFVCNGAVMPGPSRECDITFFFNPDLLFLGVLIFLGLFKPRKFLGVLGVFQLFSSVFLGVVWGSEEAKIPWCFGWFSLVFT